MKILKRILIIIVAFIALILIVALFAPKEFSGKSEITIHKSQQEVYDYIKFLKNQDNYGTWYQMDPNMQKSYTGTDGSVGFTYQWKSEKWMVGAGKQVITNLDGQKMESDLFFEDHPKPAKSVISVTEKSPDETLVKWSVKGETDYPFTIFNLFFDMDKDFEEGLQNLKNQLEK